VTQDTEQEVESGDTEQTFDVTGGGDNSNACQVVQGINNTGNSVNSVDLLQYGSIGELEVEDAGQFAISPEQNKNVDTVCDSKVNQAASAAG
jgi:hypothetical protein